MMRRVAWCIMAVLLLPALSFSAEEQPKTPRLTCGKCPTGYATTARTIDEKICKEDDHGLVECIPIGMQSQMPVCGTCPEGYLEIGRSLVPALCGDGEGGLRTQCQLPKIEGGLPDPTQGGKRCPPDCAGYMPAPGQGALPSPPKIPAIKNEKEPQ